jgi:hypothetical protein
MNKIKITAGIIWAIGCLLLMTILYFALGNFSAGFAKLPFMKLNPTCTGGEISQQIVMDDCTLMVRKPVFDGLIREKKKGFVQIDWRGNIPDVIDDTIDFNLDKEPDFIIRIDKSKPDAILKALNPKVRNIDVSTSASYGWSVRVNINK